MIDIMKACISLIKKYPDLPIVNITVLNDPKEREKFTMSFVVDISHSHPKPIEPRSQSEVTQLEITIVDQNAIQEMKDEHGWSNLTVDILQYIVEQYREDPYEKLTTTFIAEQLGCTNQTIRDNLKPLFVAKFVRIERRGKATCYYLTENAIEKFIIPYIV